MHRAARCCLLICVWFVGVGLGAVPQPARAVEPDEILRDAKLESRARDLSAELRCLVCQNQSIDDSQADLARDLRVLVRQRLQAGDTDAQVRAYLVARYGDFILLQPPFKIATFLLWGGPFLILLGGAATLFAMRPRRTNADTAPLSTDEKAALDRLLSGG